MPTFTIDDSDISHKGTLALDLKKEFGIDKDDPANVDVTSSGIVDDIKRVHIKGVGDHDHDPDNITWDLSNFADSFSIKISKAGSDDTLKFNGAQSITDEGHGKWTVTYSHDGQTYTVDVDADHANVVICFTAGTQIATIEGLRKVEDLHVGDLVLTMDNGYQPLRWLGHRHLDAAALKAAERLRPVRIKAGALGHNRPETDLVVSPQHRILLHSKIAYRMFGEHEVLLSAHKLTALDGIDIAWDQEPVTYFHMMFDRHEIVYANGAPAESLHLGKMAVQALSDDARREIMEIFPSLEDADFQQKMARFTPEKGKHARKLLERHQINNKPVLQEFR